MSEEHTVDILTEIYDFMGIPFVLESEEGQWGGLLQGETNRGYYGLSRDKGFDPNHWTKELNREVSKETMNHVLHLY